MHLSIEIPYGVAMTSRLLQIMGLFCNRALQKRLYSAKETYNFKEPTDHSHPISEAYGFMYLARYGLDTISRLLKMIGLFCKNAL